MIKYVVNDNYMQMFIALREKPLSITEINSFVNLTYGQLHKTLRGLESEGYVYSVRKGREKKIVLTPAGQGVADGLLFVNNAIYHLKTA